MTPPLPRPALQAVITNGNLKLAWPLIGVEYRLQETSTPAISNSWQTSSATIQITTNGIETQVLVTNVARYFRLRK